MAITKGSDFKSLLTDASTFLSSLSSVSRNYNESVSSAKSILSTLDFSTWSDNVGQKVNTYVSSLSTGVDAIYNDINSGAFVSLGTLVSYLCNALSNCIAFNDTIFSIDQTINNNTFNTDNMAEYNALIAQRRGYDSQLDAAVQDCNNILTSINQVLFNSGVDIPEPSQVDEIPQIEYSPLDTGSDAGTGDPGEGTEETPELTTRDKVVQDFNYDDYASSMDNLFQYGIFDARFRCGDTAVSLKKDEMDGLYYLYGPENQKVPDISFTRDQVMMQDDGSYSREVYDTVVDYFVRSQNGNA